ncbi:hypothetical protein SCATT_01490 [Streptantibioticus cattleyicolor NRRL 8057 = DSM 46488]|uniref:Uncharacterized protein n=1 Tax=Streptantibioticus cattleyicolor (strain ATCC 35852 / DSM 46488 / JCM 4925 / NBRC 14057 / NRRL 8057) TaxID=1003195 RepID=G8X1J1_STREN|nr:hypothetical protein SCATT_01490 [Streptantibioticus cattleyicolor NRRL 8057 = DSM 46488]
MSGRDGGQQAGYGDAGQQVPPHVRHAFGRVLRLVETVKDRCAVLQGSPWEGWTPWPGLPAQGADDVEGVVHQPLPARADQAAGRTGVPLVQSHAPAGDRGPGAGGPVRGGGDTTYYPLGERVPVHRAMGGD